MESSRVLREPSAKGSDEAPTVKDADEALLEICKEMSATLQRLELHLTTRAQAAGMSAISNAKTVHEAAKEEQDPTPELVSGHNACIFGDVSITPGDIPPPPTVIYKGALDQLQRIAKEYEVSESAMTGRIRTGDIHGEIVDNLPQSNTSVDWKYYVPLFDKNSSVGERVGRGRGRTNFGWKWNLSAASHGNPPVWELNLARFVPYSHVLPRRRTLVTLFTEEQHAVFRKLLGGFYTVPSDRRLALVFQAFELQQHSYDNAKVIISKFLSSMEILRYIGGSFTIRDYDDSYNPMDVSYPEGRAALYGYKKGVLKATAQDAEEYVINIPPIQLDKAPGTSPWRRLIVCEGFARFKDGLFWVQKMGFYFSLIRLHLSNGRRTAAELDDFSSKNIFHINWFVLEDPWVDEDENLDQLYTNMKQKPIWRHGKLYGTSGSQEQTLGVTSFTIQAIPFHAPCDLRSLGRWPHDLDDLEFESINPRDSMYWTILILKPIWYNRDRQGFSPLVDISNIKIEAMQVTVLSAIEVGLSKAVESWGEIGDYLEKLLGGEDTFLDPELHDKFCFYDHNDLSQSKKCFWIINSVDKFDKSIQDTLYQWEWFFRTHIKYLLSGSFASGSTYELLYELRKDIDLLHQNLKAQSERFLAIQREARELRDGLFGASNLINAKESVQEAKNSARLGETVKLLTLVTIFFLPLGYITSLWAIIAAPDLKRFASVSVGTALATYLVVLVVIKWENISTAWVASQNRLTSSWNQVAKGSKSKSEKNKNRAKDDRGAAKSRFANLRSRLHYRRGKNPSGVDDVHQLEEISAA